MTRSGRWLAVFVHALLVLGLLALFLVMLVSTPTDVGANIGAGLVLMPLLALGLPWSLHCYPMGRSA